MDATVESAWRACRLALDGAGCMHSTISQYEKGFRMLDDYLRWYRDERLKSDLGYRSPMQYRRDLELIP